MPVGDRPDATAMRVEHTDRGADRGSSGSSLELEEVSKAYGHVRAIDEVSISIGGGEFVAFLGPSGSGKTTTLMTIAGFVQPDRGRLRLDGVDITGLPPYRRNLGMVYQNYALFPHLTVERNIAFPLEMRGRSREEISRRVAAALDLVQLSGVGGRFPKQLSGGQQQRVALARALVFEPPVLLMDEPLGALDKKLREEMQREIKLIQRRLGITTVYVTHDQEEALTMSDRVVVMRDGRVEQAAAPQALYARPANAFVAEFIGAANLLRVTVVAAGPPARLRTPGGLEFASSNDIGCRAGDNAVAVIRPERIRFGTPGADGDGWRPGRVTEAAFAGGVWRYRVTLRGGEALQVVQGNLGGQSGAVGADVAVGWSPEDVWIVEEPAKS